MKRGGRHLLVLAPPTQEEVGKEPTRVLFARLVPCLSKDYRPKFRNLHQFLTVDIVLVLNIKTVVRFLHILHGFVVSQFHGSAT